MYSGRKEGGCVGSAPGDVDETRLAGLAAGDRIVEALNDRRRRFVLYALLEAAEPLGISALTDRIVAWEREVPSVEAVSDPDDVRIALYHAHLPYLAQRNVIVVNDGQARLAVDRTALAELLDTVGALTPLANER